MRPTRARGRATGARGLYAFIFGVASLAVAGAAAALVFAAQEPTETAVARPARASVPSQVGRPFFASFGVVSVDQFAKLRAPAGVADVVPPGREAIQVAVTLTNLKNSRLALSARMFGVRVNGTGADIVPTVWSFPANVSGQTARKALLRYVVPDTASPLKLAFRDPGRRLPVLIVLGRVDAASVIPLNVDVHVSHGKQP